MSASADPSARATLVSRVLVIALASMFLLGVGGFLVAVLTASEDDDASPQPTSTASTSDATAVRFTLAMAVPPGISAGRATGRAAAEGPTSSESPDGPLDALATTASEASPVSSPQPEAALAADVQAIPVVPVTRFWSKKNGISRTELVKALERGTARGYKRLIVADDLRDQLAAALDIAIHEDVARGGVEEVEEAVAKGALGLLRADDVSPRVRALRIDGRALFGNGRIDAIGDWPLNVSLDVAEDDGWKHDQTWVLVAGGDSFTDRGVYDSVVRKGRGVDYPFDGGTARVTGHGCCDPIFDDNIVPRYVLTGNKGAVRKLFRGAELAIANHEQPVTEQAVVHGSGLRFSGKPGLTRIFTRAGIDWVSLANNHIKDFGASGIKDTRRILRKHGLRFGGAGRDLEQSRAVSYLTAGDTTVAIIPCLGLVRQYWAEPDSAGATPCLDRYLVPDIKKASRQADVVIVFPHWGVEYTRMPLPSMRKHAAKWVRAGADLVLGGHSHVAGAIEDIDGSPVLYSLGNLIFDQNWSTNTMESMLLEATFHGGELAQLRLRPYIIHNQSQPNFLDPAKGEGRRLLQEVRVASKGWLDW